MSGNCFRLLGGIWRNPYPSSHEPPLLQSGPDEASPPSLSSLLLHRILPSTTKIKNGVVVDKSPFGG